METGATRNHTLGAQAAPGGPGRPGLNKKSQLSFVEGGAVPVAASMARPALLLLAAGPAALAWSCDGHMSVAQIALDSGLMSTGTVDAVTKLVTFLNPQCESSSSAARWSSAARDDAAPRCSLPASAVWPRCACSSIV